MRWLANIRISNHFNLTSLFSHYHSCPHHPGATVRYIILKPADTSVDYECIVTVEALDKYGNIATSENRPVSLITNGTAAVSGAGLVTILAGKGQKILKSTLPGVIGLRLLDAFGFGGAIDLTSTQTVYFYPGKRN